jgi:hypothetical protein
MEWDSPSLTHLWFTFLSLKGKGKNDILHKMEVSFPEILYQEDSLYRANTSDFTKRTITPVMASLAELLRNTPKYEEHYDWFVELAR